MPFHRRLESLVVALGRNLLGRLLHIVPARAGHLSVKRGPLIAVLVFAFAYLADSANRHARIEGAHLSGAAVAVARVSAPEDGFLVVHAGNSARNTIDPPALAYLPVPSGVSTDLKLELRRTASGLTPLFVVLHSDTGRKGVFEYGPKNLGTDAPRAAAGDLVWAKVLTQ